MAIETRTTTSCVQCFILSTVGYSIAIAITLGRWLLKETGELLVLFYENGPIYDDDDENSSSTSATIGKNRSGGYDDNHDYNNFESVFEEYRSKNDNENALSLPLAVGHAFLTLASSPIVRSMALFLFVVSSTTLLVGIVTMMCQFQKMKILAISSITNGKEKFYQTVVLPAIDVMDHIVLDDVMEIVVKRGMDAIVALSGCIFLYWIPHSRPLMKNRRRMIGEEEEEEEEEEDVRSGGENVMHDDDVSAEVMNASSLSKGIRQRILSFIDPPLEHTLFHPGGIWDIVSPNWRDFVIKTMKGNASRKVGKMMMLHPSFQPHTIHDVSSMTSQATNPTTSSSTTLLFGDDENDDYDDSVNTPLVSSVPSSPRVRSVRETLPTATTTTTTTNRCDASAGNPILNHHVNSRRTTRIREDVSFERHGWIPSTPPSPGEDWHLERILHRTSVISAILFVYHLHRSPNTRTAWKYMANSITSLGLISTAISAGLISSILQSNPSYLDRIINPLMNEICSSVLGYRRSKMMPVFGNAATGESNNMVLTSVNRILEVFHCVRKKQYFYLAIFILYGMLGNNSSSMLCRWRRVDRIGQNLRE